MSDKAAPTRMTAEDFIGWAARTPDEERYELHDGRLVRMMGERQGHGIAKSEIARQLLTQIPSGAPCIVLIDSVDVRVSESSVFRPDILVRCSEEKEDPSVIDDPSVVIEVLSPATALKDISRKTPAYLALPSVRCVILVDPAGQRALMASRDEKDVLRVLPRDATIEIDLPQGGVAIALEPVFDAVARRLEAEEEQDGEAPE